MNPDINISKEDHYRSLFLGPNTETSNSSEDIDKKSLILDEMLPHLPDPVRLDDLLRSLRQRFEDYPDAMLGEVGLDRPLESLLTIMPSNEGYPLLLFHLTTSSPFSKHKCPLP